MELRIPRPMRVTLFPLIGTPDSGEPVDPYSDEATSGGYSHTPDPIAARERAILRFPASRERTLWNLLNRGGLDVAGTPKVVEESGRICWRVLNKFGRSARRMTLPKLLSRMPESVDEIVNHGLAKLEMRLDRTDIATIKRMEPGWHAEMAVRNSGSSLPAVLDDHRCVAFRRSAAATGFAGPATLTTVKRQVMPPVGFLPS
jgi:hypothetical protein